MKTRRLGKNGPEVSAVGMGCMGFSHGYGPVPSEEEAVRLIRRAYDLGCTFFDTAEGYGPYVNEELVGRAVAPFRHGVVLATKFSPIELAGQYMPEGKLSRSGVRRAVEDSLRRLRTDYIDVYYEHRVPAGSAVEEVALWMGELIHEGKIRGWGQSQPTEEQIRRAHAVTPLTAVQSEYSMMERMFEKDVIPACPDFPGLDAARQGFRRAYSGHAQGRAYCGKSRCSRHRAVGGAVRYPGTGACRNNRLRQQNR